ncbi:BTAD domain-containing putative transcriptional regulator [Actinomadura sp. 1N219]|uniref:AfsR/SARP family transcriptional regulator n=1 Tax=Actinomadura sp. 1N219 TaxID=3375152 RepID=UPI0037A833E1
MADEKPDHAGETVRFEVLGPMRIERGGGVVAPPRSPILRGILAALLVAGARPLTAARLIDLVWEDKGERVAPGAVQVAVSRLRGWLRRTGPAGESSWTLAHDGNGYRLTVPDGTVDLGRFRASVKRAAAAGDVAERLGLLTSALALWRGPVLADLDAVDLADPLFRAVDDEVQTSAMALADAALAAGRPTGVIDRLSALAEAYPLHEGIEGRMLELLAHDGRAAEALARYRMFHDRVVEELGVEPGERVHRAYLSALSRDHGRPPMPDAAADTGTEAASVPVPAQLPPDVSDFVGRPEQVATLSRALAHRRASSLTTVSGMGGVGKSALALHVAHRMKGEFPDGTLYARLRTANGDGVGAARILEGFLLALGVAGRDVPHSAEHRAALCRSLLANRRVLIVLDDALCERDVRPLLPSSPGSAVIVTSRVPLTSLEGAVPVDLDVLTPEQALELLGAIVGSARVAAEPEAAAEIVRLCAYTPLAVRIAGARLSGRRHWPLTRLAASLRDRRRRLDELAVGDLAVRACFELSYARLPAATRRLFRHLALLEAPDVNDWVAAALLDVPLDVGRHHLEALVDAQLLTVAGTGPGGAIRYRYHDLVRIYARELAAEHDHALTRTAAVRRALGAWLALAERAAERVPGQCYALIHGTAPRWPLPEPAAAELLDDPMAWFDGERDALAAGVFQACALGLDEFAWDLAASQEKYLDLRGMAADWRRMNERALDASRRAGNVLGEAVMMRGLIEVKTWLSSDQSGEAMVNLFRHSQELVGLFERAGEPRGVSDALVMRSWGLLAMGEDARAMESARDALDLAKESGHPGGEARAHHIMGLTHGVRNVDAAAAELTRSLELGRLLGNPRVEATAMQFLGVARCLGGRVTEGHDLLVRSLEICHSLQDRYSEAFSLLYLAKLYSATGDERARPAVEAVMSISRRFDMVHHLADALHVLGELELASGRPASAVECLEESVTLWRKRGWQSFLAGALRALGHACRADGDEDAARKAWREALGLFERLDDAGATAEVGALLDGG